MPPSMIRVLYATDGCAITYSLMLLTGQEPSGAVYVVSYAWDGAGLDEAFSLPGERAEAELLARRPGVTICLTGHVASVRVRPVFVAAATPAVVRALCRGEPLAARDVLEAMDEAATFALHDGLIAALTMVLEQMRPRTGNAEYAPERPLRSIAVGRRGLTSLFVHHETQTLAAFRRLYRNHNTPFWYVARFGPEEKTLVLATRLHLFHARPAYDLRALKDLLLTYNGRVGPNPSGLDPAGLLSFAALSRFCCLSGYARGPAAARAARYVDERVRADRAEMGVLRDYIAHDRGSLKLPDREFVTYVYLAHFESFNRARLREHLDAVNVTDPAAPVGRSPLGERAAATFFRHVRAQLNIRDYVAQNVTPSVARLAPAVGAGYVEDRTYAALAADAPRGLCDAAAGLARHVTAVEERLAPHGWVRAPDEEQAHSQQQQPGADGTVLRRLLELAAAPGGGRARTALGALLGLPDARPPAPVYRVELAHRRQAFAVLAGDAWGRATARRDAAPEMAAHEPPAQMYVSRHEVFNARLAVTNIVLDVDFRLARPVPAGTLEAAMRGFRRAVLDALALLFPEADGDWAAHPCYVYKSACPPGGAGAAGSAAAASSDDGLEGAPWDDDVAAPADFGAAPDGEDWADWDAGAPAEVYTCDDDEVGAGIPGSSSAAAPDPEPGPARAPAADERPACGCRAKMGFRVCTPVPSPYAVAGADTVRGLARVLQQAVLLERDFIEPMGPYLQDFTFVDTGVYAHGRSLRLPFFAKVDGGGCHGRLLPFGDAPPGFDDPRNFHFHARPAHAVTRVLHSLGGEYESFFERKAARNREAFFARRTPLADMLRGLAVDAEDRRALEAFVADVAMAPVLRHLDAHFNGRAHEYAGATAQRVVAKPDWVLFQLCGPARFSCLRARHARSPPARTFVALSVDAHDRLCISLSQQCFATKCGSKATRTIFTAEVGQSCSSADARCTSSSSG
ncbi:helicase-primase primase subunit [Suid alphaherpesvirus 1]|nr:helicase-primase primase subunit [Suid alphaherpesvirus 1]